MPAPGVQGSRSYDGMGQMAWSPLDQQELLAAQAAASEAQWNAALQSLRGCSDVASCLTTASLPGTSISSLHTDANGYFFVGTGIVGEGTRIFPVSFDATTLQVSAYSHFFVQEGGSDDRIGMIYPGGDFIIQFRDTSGHHQNSTVTWLYPGGTRYIPIPGGADRFTVVGTSMTPDDTTFRIWAR